MHVMQAIETKPHRWTFDRYMQAAEAGLLDSARVELIDGEILEMPAQGEPHVIAVSRMSRHLMDIFHEPDYLVRIQSTIHLSRTSGPEPDVAVVAGPPNPKARGPHRPLLIVEVSDTTLIYDQQVKGSLYAANGVVDYWIVNLVSGYVEVYREPIPDSSAKHGWRYGSITIRRPGQAVAPLAMPAAGVDVARLLP